MIRLLLSFLTGASLTVSALLVAPGTALVGLAVVALMAVFLRACAEHPRGGWELSDPGHRLQIAVMSDGYRTPADPDALTDPMVH